MAKRPIAERVLLGRLAMGETVKDGFFSDFWTIRRDGRLLFADATRIAEPFGWTAASPSTLGGHAAVASLLHVGQNLEGKRDGLRAGFSAGRGPAAGASIVGDVLVAGSSRRPAARSGAF